MAYFRRGMAVVGAILLLIGAGWFVQTQGILHRYQRNLLEEPVLFGEKFEVRRDFKVDLATTYLIGLKLEKALPFSLENPTPPDGFLAEFRINSGDRIVVEGHNNSDPRRPAIMTAESTTRLLGTFFAQPERVYTLTFRMKDFAQDLAGIKGQILIRTDFVDNKSAFVNAMVNRFLAVAVAVLGLLFALLSFTGFGAAKN